MILILGSTHDDVLYFDSIMTNKHSEMILDKYPITIGTIFNQEVILVYDIYTSYISGIITSYIIQKYYVILTFVVGKCVSFSNDVKVGDIAVSKRIILGDVNQIKEANVKLGQIPKFPRSLETDEEVISYVVNAIEKRSFAHYFHASFISSNSIYDDESKLKEIEMNGLVLGHNKNVVFDCTSGGAALACSLFKIPFIAVKVVQYLINDKSSAENYMDVLKQYSCVGKAVVTCIGDIGRNDVVRE
ncbi:MAG: hypothetical protein K6C32_04165 [Bacilli bacterium]|nr:hypothetical protein [Bacilli bacterium]